MLKVEYKFRKGEPKIIEDVIGVDKKRNEFRPDTIFIRGKEENHEIIKCGLEYIKIIY